MRASHRDSRPSKFRTEESTLARTIASCLGAGFCLCLLFMLSAHASPIPLLGTALDQGFHDLYNLNFDVAQRDFAAWESQHPDDPVGPVSQAAGLLFSEFNRLGVLEAQFYENDDAFERREKVLPDPAIRGRFLACLARASNLAHVRLAKDAKDKDALFALTLSAGLEADYAALIEKRNLASLHSAKQPSVWAQRLLAICPVCYDALWRTCFSKYIIG